MRGRETVQKEGELHIYSKTAIKIYSIRSLIHLLNITLHFTVEKLMGWLALFSDTNLSMFTKFSSARKSLWINSNEELSIRFNWFNLLDNRKSTFKYISKTKGRYNICWESLNSLGKLPLEVNFHKFSGASYYIVSGKMDVKITKFNLKV